MINVSLSFCSLSLSVSVSLFLSTMISLSVFFYLSFSVSVFLFLFLQWITVLCFSIFLSLPFSHCFLTFSKFWVPLSLILEVVKFNSIFLFVPCLYFSFHLLYFLYISVIFSLDFLSYTSPLCFVKVPLSLSGSSSLSLSLSDKMDIRFMKRGHSNRFSFNLNVVEPLHKFEKWSRGGLLRLKTVIH